MNNTRIKIFSIITMLAVFLLLLSGCPIIPQADLTYSVNYYAPDADSGSPPYDENEYLEGDSVLVYGNTEGLVRSAYTFTGWNTFHDGSGTGYSSGDTFIMGISDVSLYAQWEDASMYTLTYMATDADSGDIPTNPKSYYERTSVYVLGNIKSLARIGYTFICWNTEADGSGMSYTGDDILIIGNSDIYLYPQWSADPTYTVSYYADDAQSGSAPTDSNNYLEGSTVTVLGNTGGMNRTGYTFIGWNTVSGGGGTAYAAGDIFEIGSSNVSLYAQWTTAPTFTVTYYATNAESGTAPVDSNNYLEGATVTVSGNTGTMIRSGYTFTGWNTAAGGGGASYEAGDQFTIGSSNVSLYAQWTVTPTYTVTYYAVNAESGTAPVDSNNYLKGATVTIPGNTGGMTRTGYSFAGWNTVSGGSGTAYDAGDEFIIGSSNVSLYAQWTSDPTYTVTYYATNAESGSAPTDSNNYLEGATVTVSGNTGGMTRTGYSFAGWNTASGGSGTAYDAGDEFTIGSSNVSLYAQWTADPTYTVTYYATNAESGSAPTDSNNYLEGSTVTVPGNTGGMTRTGYSFAGWNTASGGGGTAYDAGDEFTISSNVSLYAQWTADPTYTVTYYATNAESGSAPTDSNNYLEGSTVTVSGNTDGMTRTGYSFAGWNTASGGSGTAYDAGDEFTIGNSNVSLYAQWTLDTGTGAITINNPVSPVFSMSPDSFVLKTSGTATQQTISVTGGTGVTISAYYWFVNGTLRGSASSLPLDTQTNPHWFELGMNTLTLVVEINSSPYSENFIFTVEQE